MHAQLDISDFESHGTQQNAIKEKHTKANINHENFVNIYRQCMFDF